MSTFTLWQLQTEVPGLKCQLLQNNNFHNNSGSFSFTNPQASLVRAIFSSQVSTFTNQLFSMCQLFLTGIMTATKTSVPVTQLSTKANVVRQLPSSQVSNECVYLSQQSLWHQASLSSNVTAIIGYQVPTFIHQQLQTVRERFC